MKLVLKILKSHLFSHILQESRHMGVEMNVYCKNTSDEGEEDEHSF